jgi:hypothetical protein
MSCIITTQSAKPPERVILVIPGFVKTLILSLRPMVKMVFLLIALLRPSEVPLPIVLLTMPLMELKTLEDRVLVLKVEVVLEVDLEAAALLGPMESVLEERPQADPIPPER